MKKIPKIDLDKKHKYLIQSFLIGIFIYLIIQSIISLSILYLIIVSLSLVISGALISHYPGINNKNIIMSIVMPLGVLSGALLSLNFYPNLSQPFKLIVIGFFCFMYYLVSLADNIFLVVQDREEIIPLYRVAVTWSQILQVIVAIPLFAGIFKLNYSALTQSLIVSLISFLFTYYQLWIYRFEPDAKNTKIGEMLYLCSVAFFIMFTISLSVSFFPAEDFMRSLLSASILMFILNYISAYLKNEISRKMIFRYLIIVLVFLFLLIFFRY